MIQFYAMSCREFWGSNDEIIVINLIAWKPIMFSGIK